MSLENLPVYTGGCQCGAARFRIEGALGEASICHCRMCQKAFGNFFAPLVAIAGARLEWTRGRPKRFQSSNHVWRGFCAECGTPLTYEAPGDSLALAIGSFDNPEEVAPRIQWGIESKLPYADTLHRLPGHQTAEDIPNANYLTDLVSRQHPELRHQSMANGAI